MCSGEEGRREESRGTGSGEEERTGEEINGRERTTELCQETPETQRCAACSLDQLLCLGVRTQLV